MIIYVIRGTAGEYSSREEWLHCSYINKDLAEKNVLKLNEIFRKGCIKYENSINDYEKREIQKWCEQQLKSGNFWLSLSTPSFYLEELELIED